ncbi:MAG TPA: hypothetical protein ENI23_11360 [bacterium]|nr:hypothetical protein [bacterium]
MDTGTKAGLIALAFVIALALGVSQVYASSWSADPLEKLYGEQEVNISYHPDWNKNTAGKPEVKSFGWISSPVCGIDLCSNIGVDADRTHLQNQHLSQSGPIGNIQQIFDGFYIKGFFY